MEQSSIEPIAQEGKGGSDVMNQSCSFWMPPVRIEAGDDDA